MKSVVLTQYLQHLLEAQLEGKERRLIYVRRFRHMSVLGVCDYTLLTPKNPSERGAQLSFRPHRYTAQQIHDALEKWGVVVSLMKELV